MQDGIGPFGRSRGGLQIRGQRLGPDGNPGHGSRTTSGSHEPFTQAPKRSPLVVRMHHRKGARPGDRTPHRQRAAIPKPTEFPAASSMS